MPRSSATSGGAGATSPRRARERQRRRSRRRRRRRARPRRCRGETATRPAAGAGRPAARRRRARRAAGAQSATVRAIGPAWSRLGDERDDAARARRAPRVGLIVDVPQSAEGIRSEPAVSVPVAAGIIRAASAAAEPPLDPPAERSSAQGLPTWSVVPPAANSCVCRWPSSTMPGRLEPRPDVAVARRARRRAGGSTRSAACRPPRRDPSARSGSPHSARRLARAAQARVGGGRGASASSS